MSEPKNGRGALATGGVAAVLASACCLGPLSWSRSASSAWIGNLTVLEPYRPIFIGAALIALFFAWRSIFRPAHACKPGDVCAVPRADCLQGDLLDRGRPGSGCPSRFPTSRRCSTERRSP